MFEFTILAVGSLKDEALRDLAEEYIKRLKPYAKVKVIEVSAESFKPSHEHKRIKHTESERLSNYLKKNSLAQVVVLDEKGKQYNSVQLAGKITAWPPPIIFVIGGALGLNEELLNKFSNHLALSSLTFTHEFARVILLEQIYRAVTIIKGKTYHY